MLLFLKFNEITVMARTDQQFPLRLPPALKEKLENACKESGRSKNAEAVYRLEKSFEPDANPRETFEFESMERIYKEQAQELKLLREMMEKLLKKPT
ncbi:Arc family DNA-binding protein [Acinetobacter guillouiae]|uniref:Arc family DNA-binding protein n=1 Tax=Acinetobacter guillouiae TaxID=106649 RepID=UPI0030099E3A